MKKIMQFSYLSNRLCFDFFNILYKDKFNARNEIIKLCAEEGMYPIFPRNIYHPNLDSYHKFILHDSLNFFLKSNRAKTFEEILEQTILSKEDVRKYK